MEPIYYIDRISGKIERESVYGAEALKLVYGDDFLSKTLGASLLHLFVKTSFFAFLYGAWQKLSWSSKKILPFVEAFQIDPSEFEKSIEHFQSFNDFFIRRLKPSARPITSGELTAIIPADARYYFYQNIEKCDGFIVKGKKFSLKSLLKDERLARQYAKGSMVMARLCPSDYHRFHFPCAGIPEVSRLINGWLYSVNPVAIKNDLSIFTKNKRMICSINTEFFGQLLYIDVGATCVGSIHQTYKPGTLCSKGDEKGFFSFGGSSLILLFPENTIQFDGDLLEATQQGIEIRCLMGQSMGLSVF